MSYEVWGEPDDGPELPDGWLDEDDAEELRRCVGNLAMLVARLVRALRRTGQSDPLAREALDYLCREGLVESPLRETPNAPDQASREASPAAPGSAATED